MSTPKSQFLDTIGLSKLWDKMCDTFPSRTGEGATGTWNININGNAATATTATHADTSDNASNSDKLAGKTPDNYVLKEENPFEKGSAENSAVLKGGNNQVISEGGVALGADNLVGLKGFYYKHIRLNAGGKKEIANIYLSKNQVVPTITTGGEIKDTSIKPQKYWAVGDTISIVNNAKYDDIATVVQIKDGLIQIEWLDGKSPFSSIKQETILSPEDYSIYCLDKPTQGISDLGKYSFATGTDNKAINTYTEVSGKGNIAKGKFAKVWGKDNVGGYNTTTFGTGNVNLADNSLVNGTNNINEGNNSVIHGNKNKNYGKRAFVVGNENITNNENEAAFGKYNDSKNDTQFSIGIGTSDTDRKNAFEVKQNGDVYIEGVNGRIQDKLNVTPDWNAKVGEAGYIKGRSHYISGAHAIPFEQWDKRFDEDGNAIYSRYLSLDIIFGCLIREGYHEVGEVNYIFFGTEWKSLYPAASADIRINYDSESGDSVLEIKLYRESDPESFLATIINNALFAYGQNEDFIYKIANEFLPNTVLKTTPQTFSELEKKQVLTNLGLLEDEDTELPIINTTYSNLVSLVGSSTLTVGQRYRITDYVCTTTQENTQSAGHQFDVVVTATATNKLSEDATAMLHDGDTYFKYCDLSKWKLKYSLDNYGPDEDTRFVWGDTENGKGVIYYMKDEFDNECPYDFKNILMNGVYTFGRESDDSQGGRSRGNVINRWFDSEDNEYKINFICLYLQTNNNYFGTYCHDITMGSWCDSNTFGESCSNNTFGDGCSSNTFGDRCSSNTFGESCSNNTFGNICYSNTFGDECSNNTFENICYSNTFGESCSNNTFGEYCYDNTFESYCGDNTFGDECYCNTFGESCSNNTFGNSCYDNTFGFGCSSNTFGEYCNGNSFESYCGDNTFGNECFNNTFGNSCYSNTFGFGCSSNTFGESCSNNTFGNECYYNTFGNECYNNTFGEYCCDNTFGNSCSDNTFENSCGNNTFWDYCTDNTFGNSCDSNTFGESCSYNTFGNDCYDNTFWNYCYRNTFGQSCINIKCDEYILENSAFPNETKHITIQYPGAMGGRFRNICVKRGVMGTSSTPLIVNIYTFENDYEITVAKNSKGELKVYCEADLIA